MGPTLIPILLPICLSVYPSRPGVLQAASETLPQRQPEGYYWIQGVEDRDVVNHSKVRPTTRYDLVQRAHRGRSEKRLGPLTLSSQPFGSCNSISLEPWGM